MKPSKQVQQFKYVASVITNDEKYDTEILRRIGIVQDAFQNQSKVLRDNRFSLETKKGAELLSHVNPIIFQ